MSEGKTEDTAQTPGEWSKFSAETIFKSDQYILNFRSLLQKEHNNPGSASHDLLVFLKSLQVSLSTEAVRSFGASGLKELLDALNYFLDNKDTLDVNNNIKYELIRCLKEFINNKYGIQAIYNNPNGLVTMCRAFDPTNVKVMIDALKLVAAVCLLEEGIERVLEALTICHENTLLRDMNALPREQHPYVVLPTGPSRFDPIIKGFGKSDLLDVACLQLINILTIQTDDLDFRFHLRNEFMRAGLQYVLEDLKRNPSKEVSIQLQIFEDHSEQDYEELLGKSFDIKKQFQDSGDLFNVLNNNLVGTPSEPFFQSILQHLFSIRDDEYVRPQYYKLIDECVSQIVLRKNGVDPDFSYNKRFNLDVEPLIEQLVAKADGDELAHRLQKIQKQLDEELIARHEAELKLKKRNNKLAEIQSKLKEKEAQIANLEAEILEFYDFRTPAEGRFPIYSGRTQGSRRDAITLSGKITGAPPPLPPERFAHPPPSSKGAPPRERSAPSPRARIAPPPPPPRVSSTPTKSKPSSHFDDSETQLKSVVSPWSPRRPGTFTTQSFRSTDESGKDSSSKDDKRVYLVPMSAGIDSDDVPMSAGSDSDDDFYLDFSRFAVPDKKEKPPKIPISTDSPGKSTERPPPLPPRDVSALTHTMPSQSLQESSSTAPPSPPSPLMRRSRGMSSPSSLSLREVKVELNRFKAIWEQIKSLLVSVDRLEMKVNAAKDAKGDNTQVNTDASELRSSLIKWNRIIKILQNKVAQKRVQT